MSTLPCFYHFTGQKELLAKLLPDVGWTSTPKMQEKIVMFLVDTGIMGGWSNIQPEHHHTSTNHNSPPKTSTFFYTISWSLLHSFTAPSQRCVFSHFLGKSVHLLQNHPSIPAAKHYFGEFNSNHQKKTRETKKDLLGTPPHGFGITFAHRKKRPRHRWVVFAWQEHPVVLQLGGSDPASWRCALGTVVMANSPPPGKEPFFSEETSLPTRIFQGRALNFFGV